jgi:hypothetical protein
VEQDWREQALRAIRDGSCPNGHGRLDENGFCLHCGQIGVHYSIRDGDTVVCLYPEHLGGGPF